MRVLGKVILLAVLAVSCEVMPAVPAGTSEGIGFSVGGVLYGLQTRASSAVTEADLVRDGFVVAGVSEGGVVVMNEKVTFDSSKGLFLPSEKRYYSHTEEHSFFAVYPAREISFSAAQGTASVGFTHNPSSDLVTALRTDVGESTRNVLLDFDHRLARVLVQAKGKDTDVDYVVKGVSFKSAASGTYGFTTDSWTTSGEVSTAYLSKDTSVSTKEFTAFGEALNLIPGTVSVAVDWECRYQGMVVGTYHGEAPVDLDLGMISTVMLTLDNKDATRLSFTVSVIPWDSRDVDITQAITD